jgi:uncharacterized integral membrane protein
LNTGLSVTNALTSRDAANAQARAEAARTQTAQANAAATQSSATTKWLLIGGGVLVVALVAIFALRGR